MDLSAIFDIMYAQEGWDAFYAECMQYLNEVYPMRTVTMTSADPRFYTTSLKLILRRKNRSMRAGRLVEVSSCARRIGTAIEGLTRGHTTLATDSATWGDHQK